MKEIIGYHVVTDKPVTLGQHMIFDENHHNGTYARVMEKMDIVKDIYANPKKYEGVTLDHHTLVALRELALEEVRLRKYPNYPSRMACLYVSPEVSDSYQWTKLFIDWGRPTYSIIKLKIRGNVYLGNSCNCFDGTPNHEENIKMAENYWSRGTDCDSEWPITEMLCDGDLEVIKIIKEVNANLK